MGQPGEENADDDTGGEVIHQPPTANPSRTRVEPADLDHARDERTGPPGPPAAEEEER